MPPLTGARGASWRPGFPHPVFVVAALDAMSVGIIVPALPHLVEQLAGSDGADPAVWLALLAAAWGAAQFLSAPIMGVLADRFGRRPVLLAALAGLACDALFMALAPSLGWLLVGRLISGALAASIIACSAYIIDVSAGDELARRLGLLGAAWSAGFIAGPALGGALADLHLRLPFLVCGASAAVAWLYARFRLKESLPIERRSTGLVWRRTVPFGGLTALLRRRALRTHGLVLALAALADQALPTFFVLYVLERYGWSASAAGLALMGLGAARVLAQAVAVAPLTRRYGEPATLVFGLLCLMLALVVFAVAPTGLVFGLALPIYAAGAVAAPALMAILAGRVEREQQGRLQGASVAVQGAASAVGPLLFGAAYALNSQNGVPHRGAGAMLLGAALLAVAATIAHAAARVPPRMPRARSEP